METTILGRGKEIEKRVLSVKKNAKSVSDQLSENPLFRRLNRNLSVVTELVLYLFFALAIVAIVIMPSQLNVLFIFEKDSTMRLNIHDSGNLQMIMLLKLLLTFSSLPILALAVYIHKNRERGKVLYQAYQESIRLEHNLDALCTLFEEDSKG